MWSFQSVSWSVLFCDCNRSTERGTKERFGANVSEVATSVAKVDFYVPTQRTEQDCLAKLRRGFLGFVLWIATRKSNRRHSLRTVRSHFASVICGHLNCWREPFCRNILGADTLLQCTYICTSTLIFCSKSKYYHIISYNQLIKNYKHQFFKI